MYKFAMAMATLGMVAGLIVYIMHGLLYQPESERAKLTYIRLQSADPAGNPIGLAHSTFLDVRSNVIREAFLTGSSGSLDEQTICRGVNSPLFPIQIRN